jgi:RHS repeat-associated protein
MANDQSTKDNTAKPAAAAPMASQANSKTPAAATDEKAQPLPQQAQPVGDAEPGDTDNDYPTQGTTLNSYPESTVNNMTGEVSVTVPLVKMPTSQGLGPDLAINLVYTSTSPGSNSQIVSPYLQAIVPYFVADDDKLTPESLEIDWELDLPAIAVTTDPNTKDPIYTLRFQGQSYQANTNASDVSPDKTAFYYAKELEDNNGLNFSFINGTDITEGMTVTTPDGTEYWITTKLGGHYLLTKIAKANGYCLVFSYIPSLGNSANKDVWVTPGSLTVEDQSGRQVLSMVPTYLSGENLYIPCLYVNYSNPTATASSSTYDVFAQLNYDPINKRVSVMETGNAIYPYAPYYYSYTTVTVGSTSYYKLGQLAYPTGAHMEFYWLKGGYVVNYGVVHVKPKGDSDTDHTFQYSFAPVNMQAYCESDGNLLWSKQYYYSEDQASNIKSNEDNGGATYQCPNMNKFDTCELANGVNPANNWLDPLFNSSSYADTHPDEPTGYGYQSGNVSQLINSQQFFVYEITTYADGTVTSTNQAYDALQRLVQVDNYLGNQLCTQTNYSYPVSVSQLGKNANGNLAYPSYKSLPANFNKPTQVVTTSYAMFNDLLGAGGASVTTTTHTYDDYGNLTSSTASNGVSKQYTYYTGALPCHINPYIATVTTIPSKNTSVGALGTITPAVSSGIYAIEATATQTSYTVVNGLILPDNQSSFFTGGIQSGPGPITRTHSYSSLGQVIGVTESGGGFSTTQNISYSVDGNGSQTINTNTSYGYGGTGPSLPTTEVVDFLGRTVSSTDSLGRVTNFQYDSLGRIVQKTELANLQDQQLVTRYSYSIQSGGSSVTVTTPTGAQILYIYDSVGRQTGNQITPVSGSARTVRTFSYGQNAADGGPCGGQVTSATTHIAAGSSITTQYYYNSMGAQIATVPSTGLAQATLGFSVGDGVYALSFNFTYAPGSANPITAYGLATLTQMDAQTTGTANTYTFASSLLTFSGLTGTTLDQLLSKPSICATVFNPAGAANGLVNTAVMTAANNATSTAYGYDSLFRLVSETLTGDGNTLTTARQYDDWGRLVVMTDAKGNLYSLYLSLQGFPTSLALTTAAQANYYLASAEYNAAGQPTSYSNTPATVPLQSLKTYTYDPVSGIVTSETDALGNTIHYLYYATGLLAAAYSLSGNGFYLWASLEYDPYGAITTQQNGAIATQPSLTNLTPENPDAVYMFAYNSDGLLTTKTIQYAGQPAKTTHYQYDGFGNMSGFSNAFGQNITVSLDQYGRKSKLTNGPVVAFAETSLHEVDYAYDSLGRPSTITKLYTDAAEYCVSVLVDTLTYSYNDLLQTTGVSSQLSFSNPNPENAAQVSLDSAMLNFSQTLSYDIWGNIIANTQTFTDQTGQTVNKLYLSYSYDSFDRLVDFNSSPWDTNHPANASGQGIQSELFSYDASDNLQSITTVTSAGTAATRYNYNQNQPFLLESVENGSNPISLSYDALGRAVTDAYGNTIGYDATGRIATITLKNGEVISYGYGPNRELIKQSLSDGTAIYTYYENGQVVARQDQTGNIVKRTLLGMGDDSTFTTSDLLGSPVLTRITSSTTEPNYEQFEISENVTAKNLYSPTGIQTNLAAANPNSGYPQNLQAASGSPLSTANLSGAGLGYNTEITDPLTGYQLLGSYRAYDPVLGRFLQPDSASPGAGGTNPYAYTANQFVGCSDPTGHFTYTYKSYHQAVKAIKEAAERKARRASSGWGGFFDNLLKSYLSVVKNLIKHPGNPNSWVAAGMLYANPAGPLDAAIVGQLGQVSPVGAFIAGAYDGVTSAVDGTVSLGMVQYNPQTGLGTLNIQGAGNVLGIMSAGYVTLSPTGGFQLHTGHGALTHLENEGKGLGDMAENIVSGMAGVAIGLCYDMPMDFAHGEYYEAGFALGMNAAQLVAMVAAPEDAEGEAAADDAGGAGSAATKEENDLPRGAFKAFGKGFFKEIKPNLKAGEGYANATGRFFDKGVGSKAVRMYKAGRFTDYVGEYLGKKIGGGLTSVGTYNNLNMSDPRSPWSTAAWQNMLYRQGPYTPDKN